MYRLPACPVSVAMQVSLPHFPFDPPKWHNPPFYPLLPCKREERGEGGTSHKHNTPQHTPKQNTNNSSKQASKPSPQNTNECNAMQCKMPMYPYHV